MEKLEDRTLPSGAPLGYATPDYIIHHPTDGVSPNATSPIGKIPSQILKAYRIDHIKFNGTIVGDGTGQTIAIVDAFDDPKFVSSNNAGFANSDLAKFDAQFGIPDPPSFTKVNQTGGTVYPAVSNSWSSEIALDCEWAHALAPKAKIVLVEASSNSFANLDTAENTAATISTDCLGQTIKAVAVSNSWSGGEFSGENTLDSNFNHPGVVHLASTGDFGAPGGYPAFSPNVVAVGGTSLFLDAQNNWQSESGWSGSGGGISTQEPQPSYQNGVVNQWSTTKRTAPDVSMDADPNTGVAVYDSQNGGSSPWFQFGGTSVSCPCFAAIVAIIDQGVVLNGGTSLTGPTQFLPKLYSITASNFHDVTTGNNGFAATVGYDLVTGRGTPIADSLVNAIAVPPVTRVWTGAGTTNNWSDPNNWQGGVAPNAGDNIGFGPGAARLTNVNDLAAGTTFGAVVFSSAGYSISGNSLILNAGVDASTATGTNTFNISVTMGASGSISTGGAGTVLNDGGTVNTNGNALTIGGTGGAANFTAVISGAGSVTDSNSGTTTFSATNGYTGGTTVSAGTLVANAAGGNAIPGNVSVSGATLREGAANQIADTAAVSLSTGTLDLSNNSDAIGAFTLSNSNVTTGTGTLTLGGNVTETGTSSLIGLLNVGSGARTVTVNASSTLTDSAATSGSASITKAGTGTLVLSGTNSYTGGTFLTAGTLSLGGNTAAGTGSLTLNGGTVSAAGGAVSEANAVTVGGNVMFAGSFGITLSGAVTLTGNRTLTVNNTGGLTLSGVVGESGGARTLTKAGSQVLTLSNANTYSGGTTLSGGTLSLGNNGAIGAAALTVTAGTLSGSGAPLTLGNAITLNGNLTVGGSQAVTLNGAITLTANRQLTTSNTALTTVAGAIGESGGARTLTKAGGGRLLLLAGNTYTGGTVLNGGTLIVDNAGSVGTGTLNLTVGTIQGNASAVTLSNALSLNGNVTIAGNQALTFTGAATLTGTRTITVNNTGGTTLSGNIGQSVAGLGLSKSGTGTLVLSGTNTYTGTTTINTGTLLVNGSQAGSAVSVHSGATLGGSGTVGNVTALAGGNVQAGSASGTGTLSTGTLTMSSSSNFNVVANSNVAGTGYDQVVASGAVTLTGSKLVLTLGYTPAIGDAFTIIANNSGSAVVGQFTQGTTFSQGGMVFSINYAGGVSGHDVIVTRIS